MESSSEYLLLRKTMERSIRSIFFHYSNSICIHNNQFCAIKIRRNKTLFSNNFPFIINHTKVILKIKQRLGR